MPDPHKIQDVPAPLQVHAASLQCAYCCELERPQSRLTDPLLLIYSFQFRSAFRATTTLSQPQIRRPYKAPTSVVTDNLVKLIVVQI